MNKKLFSLIFSVILGSSACAPAPTQTLRNPPAAQGWLNWRGPDQKGVSQEKSLPTDLSIKGKNLLWSVPLSGGGAPIADTQSVCVFGYRGEGPELEEVLACYDRKTGDLLWEQSFSDFLSDIIYERYGIGSPAIDEETGNIYLMTSNGVVHGFSRDGQSLWQHSMMEEFGRLTFPNGRTGTPVIVENLLIVRGIVTSWGTLGPARDRFYAFEKKTGELVWISTPGTRPQDSSFSTPVLSSYLGEKVLYAGTGCGNVVCMRAADGKPLWRFQLSRGGVNASVLTHEDKVIAIHGKENLDSSQTGRMVSIQPPDALPDERQLVLGKENEVWRNIAGHFTSSGVLVDDRVYQVLPTGELVVVDASSGKTLWTLKLGSEQLHASPLFANGFLYVPLRSGKVFVLKPGPLSAEIISETQLEGSCLGAPSAFDGQVFIHTTEALYAFGKPRTEHNPGTKKQSGNEQNPDQDGASLQIVPAEITLLPDQPQTITAWKVDDRGKRIETIDPTRLTFADPSTKDLGISFAKSGKIVAAKQSPIDAKVLEISAGKLSGRLRVRILGGLPYSEDFENTELKPHPKKGGVPFSHPPGPWIGAKMKWEVRDLKGNKVLRKTLDRVLFQRATTFIGPPEMSSYTVSADVMSDGNRRVMSTVGLVNQRYLIALKGNWQQLEVSSNYDRIQVGVPFSWKAGQWYRLKTRVDISKEGIGFIRAKAWLRGEAEPDAWLLEVPHKRPHRNGAPGFFGFSPQAQFPVYVDNLVVQPNE